MHERPPPRPTGPLPTPRAGFGVPRRASRHARATPVSPRAGPARQRPFADSSEPYRSHRARNLSTHGSVSSCRMPLSRSSAYISRPGLAGPADVLKSGREAGRLPCAARRVRIPQRRTSVVCPACADGGSSSASTMSAVACESPPAARRLRTTGGRRVIMRAVITVASSACSRFVDGRPERRPGLVLNRIAERRAPGNKQSRIRTVTPTGLVGLVLGRTRPGRS